ncbi:MAG: hypothetical protein K6E29_02985 [Cyanobacteria bacterium RUI128]|nr:hypothetical protein [Cyanobacteria bacterium RUI128]
MSIAINELKAMDFTHLKRDPEEQDYINNQKRNLQLLENEEKLSLDNKDANKQKLLETANLLRSAQTNETLAETSDKSQVEINNKNLQGGISKISGEDNEFSAKLSSKDHEMIYSALLGTYFEENGEILKKGILANINRYFHRAYINYLTDIWISGQYPYNDEVIRYINMFPYPGPYDPISVLRMWTMMLLICARFRIINLLNHIYFWPLF